MAVPQPPEREPTSAAGDFYVENHCCTACGIPQHVAPDLIGWTDDQNHCRWKKQPEDEYELQQVFAIFDQQELGCHRYSGTDPTIQDRIGLENCDLIESRNFIVRGRLIIGTRASESHVPTFISPEKPGIWRRVIQMFAKRA